MQTITMANKLEFLIGCPDNPNSKAKSLFNPSYLMLYNGGINSFLKKFGNLLNVVEVHFQLFNEVALKGKEYEKIKKYVSAAGKKGISLMAHMPFLYKKGENFLNFDYKWLVVPSEYSGKNKKQPIAQIGSRKIYAREVTDNEAKDTVTLADKLGIKLLTLHVTKPGLFLEGEDWKKYKNRIKELENFIKEKNYNVTLSVETGGVTEKQLVELNKKYGTAINFDIAHYVLDQMSLGKTQKDANNNAVKFYNKNKKIIRNLHLTQTSLGADLHRGIFEEGILTCNEEIIREIAKDRKKGLTHLCLFESPPDVRDYEQVAKALREEKPGIFREGKHYVLIGMGLPATGKAETLDFMKDAFDSKAMYIRSDEITKDYFNALSFIDKVPEIRKQKVYDEIHRRLEKSLASGQNVILHATYHKKERRNQLKRIINSKKFNVADVYIVHCVSNNKNIKKRLEERKKEGQWWELADFSRYKALKKEGAEFSRKEFPHAHIIEYNTGKQTINVWNNDYTTESLVASLKDKVEKKYNASIKVFEKS